MTVSFVRSVRPEDPWPDAISDGLTLPCYQCGRIPSLDYRVSDEAWRRVIPPAQRLGVACLQCFLTSGGQPSDVEQIQVTGHAQTLVLKPAEMYSYPGRSNPYVDDESYPKPGDLVAKGQKIGEVSSSPPQHTSFEPELAEWEHGLLAEERHEAMTAIAKVRKIHEPMLVFDDTVINLLPGVDEDPVREIQPGSAEEILSREIVCMVCMHQPWPCATAEAVYRADEIRDGLIGEVVP